MKENKTAPRRIKIVPDDYHAEWVGKTKAQEQFFITTPFSSFREFLALFIWRKDGSFKEAKIDNLGPREELDESYRARLWEDRIQELGEITLSTIEVAPFEIEQFGLTFGLIYYARTDETSNEIDETVELHPGNYMAFYPPWTGEYDT